MAAISLLGGQCVRCGWDKNPAGLQFHHAKPGKHFQIGDVAHKSWSQIKKELKKCILLCANCHCIEHSTRDDPAFQREVEKYQGDFYD